MGALFVLFVIIVQSGGRDELGVVQRISGRIHQTRSNEGCTQVSDGIPGFASLLGVLIDRTVGNSTKIHVDGIANRRRRVAGGNSQLFDTDRVDERHEIDEIDRGFRQRVISVMRNVHVCERTEHDIRGSIFQATPVEATEDAEEPVCPILTLIERHVFGLVHDGLDGSDGMHSMTTRRVIHVESILVEDVMEHDFFGRASTEQSEPNLLRRNGERDGVLQDEESGFVFEGQSEI